MLHSKLLVELLCNDMQVHVKQVCKTESIPNTENQHAVQLRGGESMTLDYQSIIMLVQG